MINYDMRSFCDVCVLRLLDVIKNIDIKTQSFDKLSNFHLIDCAMITSNQYKMIFRISFHPKYT